MIKITTVYPADPLGVIPGGIDTCIRDIIRSAPEDIQYSLLGATTDPIARPVRRWTTCTLGNKQFNFFPLYAIDNPEVQPKIPATVKHLLPLMLNKPRHEFDILEFHRIEPMLLYIRSPVPKFTFIHQNMEVIDSKESDIRWKHIPAFYYKMENWLIPKFNTVFCVNRQGVDFYKSRFPGLNDKFRFIPTWMNPDIFFPADKYQREEIRNDLVDKYRINQDATLLLSVGRIDKQKNPHRLINAVDQLIKKGEKVHLLMVGDGMLRNEVENLVHQLHISDHITIAGILPNYVVAKYLRGSDILVLASNYEGMPMCVLEALGCGIPVVTTDVGEVKKVVKPGINGQIAKGFEPDDFSEALYDCVNNIQSYKGKPCLDSVKEYTPKKVLSMIYDAYRESIKNNNLC